MAEELESAADGEYDAVVVDVIAQRLAALLEVGLDTALLTVLSSADEHDVGILGRPVVADVDAGDRRLDLAGGAAALDGAGVAAVAVEVEQVGIEHRDVEGVLFSAGHQATSQRREAPSLPSRWRTSSIAV